MSNLSRETSEKDLRVIAVEDGGCSYELEVFTLVNSEYNISNGGVAEMPNMYRVFRLKKDGSRGLRLTGWNKRFGEVIKSRVEEIGDV